MGIVEFAILQEFLKYADPSKPVCIDTGVGSDFHEAVVMAKTTFGDVGMLVVYAGSVEELEETVRHLEERTRQAGFQTAKCHYVA